jgi:hypothetical protein
MSQAPPNNSLFGGYLLPVQVAGTPVPMPATSSPSQSAPCQQLPGFVSRGPAHQQHHHSHPPPMINSQTFSGPFGQQGPSFYPIPPSVFPPNVNVAGQNRDLRGNVLTRGVQASSTRPSAYATFIQSLDVPPTMMSSAPMRTLPPPHPHPPPPQPPQHQPPVCSQAYQPIPNQQSQSSLSAGMMHIDPLRHPHYHQRHNVPPGARRPITNGPPGPIANLHHHMPGRRMRHLAAAANFPFVPPPPIPSSSSSSSSNSMAAAAAAAATVALAEYHSTLRSFGLPAVCMKSSWFSS